MSISYQERWGKPRVRQSKGHPKRELRRLRAAERLAAHSCGPQCKRNRKAGAG
jgi:hypothetical protein